MLFILRSVRPQNLSMVAKWLHLPARHLLDSIGLYDIHMNPMANLLHVHSRFLRHLDLIELLKVHRWLQHWIAELILLLAFSFAFKCIFSFEIFLSLLAFPITEI